MTTSIQSVAHDALQAAGEARKGLAALIGVVAMLTELNVLHGTAQHWAALGTAAATAAVTYLAPNGPIIRALDKLEDGDVGVGMLDDVPDELAEPVSKPDLPAAPVADTAEPAQAAPHPSPGGKHVAPPSPAPSDAPSSSPTWPGV
jgi:hypothetical protein